MLKTFLRLWAAVICGLGLFTGCGGNPDVFISFKVPGESTAAKLGMSRDDIYSKLLIGWQFGSSELSAGVKFKWPDDTSFDNCIAMIDSGSYIEMLSGLSTANTMSDVLPKYQKDPDVKVLTSETAKIVLGKQIDGVNYAIAVRGYSDGSIKTITIYNAALYVDNDADYQ